MIHNYLKITVIVGETTINDVRDDINMPTNKGYKTAQSFQQYPLVAVFSDFFAMQLQLVKI